MWALLFGCEGPVLLGEVRSLEGGIVAGATLSSPECQAVTGADGRFRVGCAEGTRTFIVSHPDHLARTWPVQVDGWGEHELGGITLAAIPAEDGLWLASDGVFQRLPLGPLVRKTALNLNTWCFDGTRGSPTSVGAAARLLDNHAVDWRLYKVDPEGCPWKMSRSGAEHWTFEAVRVATEVAESRGPGRDWVELALEPGDYAIVEWYEGFLVPDENGLWRAHWLRVEGQAAPG